MTVGAQRRQPTDTPVAVDLLVIGLGPAGAVAAAEAARRGLRVVGVDRKTEAGIPVQCAEFVPAMIGTMLAADASHALAATRRQLIGSMATQVEDQAFDIKDNFPGHMIDRAAFDAMLVGAAVDAGAQCAFKTSLSALDNDGIAVLSDGRRIAAKVIVGADGPRSRVAAAIGQGGGAVAETRQITVPLLRTHTATDIFLSAGVVGGYAWLFPKGDVANLGLGVMPEHRHRLKPLLSQLHARLIAEGRLGAEILRTTGGAIPVGGMNACSGKVGGRCVLLAGDAAGLTNPVTGAGINPAVISGRLAGEAAVRIVAGDAGAAAGYHEDLHDLFGASLERALARRRELMDTYAAGGAPTALQLRRGWIAYPQFWAVDVTPENKSRPGETRSCHA